MRVTPSHTRLVRCALLTFVAFAALPVRAIHAQTLPTGPAVQRALRDTALAHDIPGRWVMSSPAVHAAITPAQRTAMIAQLGSIANLLRASLGTLPGVEADASMGVEPTRLPAGASVVGGDLKLLLWPYSVRNGRLQFYDNAAEIIMWVNRSACRGPDAIGSGYGFVLAPRVNGRFHGFPMLDSVVVITHRTAPPCIPVTRGEVVQALAHRMNAETARAESASRAGAADQQRALRETEKSNPALAAQLRQEMARLQHVSDSIQAAAESQIGGAYARMSPAERASPAYLSARACRSEDLNACFVDASAPGARAVVRENPAFFDVTRPSDVQIITLDLHPLEGARRNAQYPTSVMDAAFAKLDWAAMSALVR